MTENYQCGSINVMPVRECHEKPWVRREGRNREYGRKREETREHGSTLEEGAELAFTFQMTAEVTLSSLFLYNVACNRVVNIKSHPGLEEAHAEYDKCWSRVHTSCAVSLPQCPRDLFGDSFNTWWSQAKLIHRLISGPHPKGAPAQWEYLGQKNVGYGASLHSPGYTQLCPQAKV